MNLTKQELLKAKDIIRQVLEDIRPELMDSYGNIDSTDKADDSPVTILDLKVEEKLKEALLKEFPDIAFSGEEGGVDYSKETFWLVDPIDGTMPFIRGLPYCSNMLALIHKGEPILSVINNFPLKEFYWAIKGEGAYCNDKPINVNDRHKGEKMPTLIYIEAGEDYHSGQPIKKDLIDMGYHALQPFSAGYFFTVVAAGKAEARIQYKPWGHPYDFAPGALLIKEAGGRVANIGSDTYDYQNLDFVASNVEVFDDLADYFTNL